MRLAPLPMAGVFHAGPGFLRRQVVAFLQQLDRDIVRAAHESHMAIPWRTIDRDTCIHQLLAHLVDIFDAVSQMTEMTAVRWQTVIAVPVIGQLNRAFMLTGRSHENQREPTLVIVDTPRFFQSQQAKEGHRLVKILDPDHRVQIADFHRTFLISG